MSTCWPVRANAVDLPDRPIAMMRRYGTEVRDLLAEVCQDLFCPGASLPFHLVMPPDLEGGGPVVRSLEVPAAAGSLMTLLFPHLAGLEVSLVAHTGNVAVICASVS